MTTRKKKTAKRKSAKRSKSAHIPIAVLKKRHVRLGRIIAQRT
jgi:hypothetical protein